MKKKVIRKQNNSSRCFICGISNDKGLRTEFYELEDGTLAATAGDEIVLDLYWEALSTPGANWTLFTHLVGSEFNPATQGPLWGQWDGMPGEGTWPTSTWQAGDVAVERIIIPIDPAAPAGTYTLALGLYDSSTGERAEIRVDGQDPVDQLVATTVVQVTAR